MEDGRLTLLYGLGLGSGFKPWPMIPAWKTADLDCGSVIICMHFMFFSISDGGTLSRDGTKRFWSTFDPNRGAFS